MKHIWLLSLLSGFLVFNPLKALSEGFSFDSLGESLESIGKSIQSGVESGVESVEGLFSGEDEPKELSVNIMRRVNSANQSLDNADEQIRTGRSEHAPRQLASARKEYDNIFKYYEGSFDPNHPTLLALKARINRVDTALSAPPTVAQPASRTPVVNKTQATHLSTNKDITKNIMRSVNSANQSLDNADEQIRTGRSEHAPRQLASARKEYDNIFKYYKGSFDPNHPTLTTLKARMDQLEVTLTVPQAQVSASPVVSQSGSQPSQPSQVSSSPAPLPNIELASQISPNKDITKLIRKQLKKSNDQLNYVFENAAQGKDSSYSLGRAKTEYNNIFKYYHDQFDPNHPEIVAVKNRIIEAERVVRVVVAQRNATIPIETNSKVVDDLPPQIGEKLLSIASLLFRLEQDMSRLEQNIIVKENSGYPLSSMQEYEGLEYSLKEITDLFNQFDSKFQDQFDPNHVAYKQVKTRLQTSTLGVSRIVDKAASMITAENTARSSAYDAEEQKIMGTYNNQPPTSNLHRNNVGRMVWSTKKINKGDQDKITLKTSFTLSDPIFGRVYLVQSIGNTPVYGSGANSKPSDNYEYRYVFKLLINDEVIHDVFVDGRLRGEAGQTWTTFQFSPNPVPFDHDYRHEAEAWQRATKKLIPGTHAVRFELWCALGQYRSAEPVSVGEFSLIVKKGERVAAGMKFPEDTYDGRDLKTIRKQMFKALVGPVAKSKKEILKVSVTSDWRPGVYTDTKKSYRKISGTVLWYDKDNDGICRFTTINFISDHLGRKKWTPVRYKSMTTSMEGDTECP